MTSSSDVVSSHTSTSLPTIYTANGSPMHVSHLGNVSTPTLYVSNFYHIPNSLIIFYLLGNSLNLIFLYSFLLLVWLCRILRRDRSLGLLVRSEGCLSSSFFIYRPLVSLLMPSQDIAPILFLYGILALVMHLSLGLNN